MSRACVWARPRLCYRALSQRRLALNSRGGNMSGRLKLAASFSILFLAGSGIACAQQQVIGAPPEARNMKLVGTNDLQARSGYQPTIHHQGDRWIAYIGHHGGSDDIPAPVNPQTGKAEPNGTSIVDVTDPAQPKYLRHLPGQEGKYECGGAQMVRICDGKALPKGDRNAVYMLRTFGGEAHEIWNVADPANPVLITRIARIKGHAQELVGMRHRHCLPGVGRAGLAHAPHDADLRSLRSRAPAEDPRFRPSRPGARLDRRGADRTARADLDGPFRQPGLFRLRHQQGRLPADRRSRETAQRPEGADRGQSASAGDLADGDVGVQRRPHHVSDAGHADCGIRAETRTARPATS